MIVAIAAGRTSGGHEVEHTIPVIDGSPASERITETVRSAGEAAAGQPEAAELLQVESRREHLASALNFLQSESRRMTDDAIQQFDATIERSITEAAAGKMVPTKLLEGFDRADRLHRGYRVLLEQTAKRLDGVRIPSLVARANWLEAFCVRLEAALAEHEQALATALSGAVQLEGGISTQSVPGSYSHELRRIVSELSGVAGGLRKQAKDLEPREPGPPSDAEFFANLNSGKRA